MRYRVKKDLVALLLIAFACIPNPAKSSDVVFTFSGGNQNSFQEFTYGFDFTPVQDIIVESLGFYDFGSDGLDAGHRVGIWTQSEDLLASTLVTTGNSELDGPVINGGQFRFTTIDDLKLSEGVTYRFGAAIEGASDVWFAGPGLDHISAAPSLATVSDEGYFASGNFVFPSQTIFNAYGAGSFTARAIPEPGSGALVACVFMLFHSRSRRRS